MNSQFTIPDDAGAQAVVTEDRAELSVSETTAQLRIIGAASLFIVAAALAASITVDFIEDASVVDDADISLNVVDDVGGETILSS